MTTQHYDSRMSFAANSGETTRQTNWLEATWAPRILSIVRIVVALIFMEHGTQKWLNFPPLARAAPEFLSMSGFGGAIELIGGALLALGLFTRPVAFILCGEMAIAYWSSHAPRGFFPVLNGGDAAILYCFIFLYFAVAGGGAWSLDRLVRKKG
jgi:putative oxidoreductase